MLIKSKLQDVLVVLAIGLLKRLARIPFFHFENGIPACCTLGLHGNTPDPFCHSKSRLFCRHDSLPSKAMLDEPSIKKQEAGGDWDG